MTEKGTMKGAMGVDGDHDGVEGDHNGVEGTMT